MNILQYNQEVPRIPRNKRIYGGDYSGNVIINNGNGGGSDNMFFGGEKKNLLSHTIVISFSESYNPLPLLLILNIYKWEEIFNGKWKKKEILWYFFNNTPITANNCTFAIDNTENLTGIIIEYLFKIQ